jgi:hypothetical protein
LAHTSTAPPLLLLPLQRRGQQRNFISAKSFLAKYLQLSRDFAEENIHSQIPPNQIISLQNFHSDEVMSENSHSISRLSEKPLIPISEKIYFFQFSL